MCLNSELFET
ncbi:hypothetical protein C370_07370 [Cryptococcus neoformans A1-35-8]|nr:hypothetical protein C370_07370 [Cryptococcus neoformans var. grubii A1-35-8]